MHGVIVDDTSRTAVISAVVSLPVLFELQRIAERDGTTVPAVAGAYVELHLFPPDVGHTNHLNVPGR